MLSVLYPMELVLKTTGEVLHIKNHPQISARFNSFLIKANKEYKGVEMTRFLKMLENKIASAYSLQASMEKDWFWANFFLPIYDRFGYQKQRKTSVLLPPFKAFNPCLNYIGVLKTSKEQKRPNIFGMQFNAAVTLHSEGNNTSASIASSYELSADNLLIKEIISTAQLIEQGKVIKTIESTIIHLVEKDTYIKSDKPKSFWSTLFS
ncbi:MAG: hypothetical protein JKY08_08060 [Flavobacteriaceae bacterium]|nr:hypothetical protein [Flavobacteriaceae bacterium]